MLNFNRMVPGKLYRVTSKISLPYDIKNPNKGSLVTVLSENMEMTARALNNRFLDTKRYNRYYLERKINENFAGVKVIDRNDQDEIYHANFGKVHPNIELVINTTLVHDYNVIYELGQYSEKLGSINRIEHKNLLARAQTKVDLIMDRLQRIKSEFPNHKKYLIIPIDEYIDNPKDTTIWTKRTAVENFGLAFIRAFDTQYNVIKQKLSDWTFVFINMNEMFYVTQSNLDDDFSKLLRTLFKHMKSSKNHIDTSEISDENMAYNEVDNDKVMLSANENKINTLKKDITDIVDGSKLPDDVKLKVLEKANSITSDAMKSSKIDNTKNIVKDEEPKENTKKTLANTIISGKSAEVDTSDIDKYVDEMEEPEVSDIDIEDVKQDIVDEIEEEIVQSTLPNASVARLARIKKLKNEMRDIEYEDGKTIESLVERAENRTISEYTINKSTIINPKMKNIKFNNFEKDYNDKLLEYDLMNVLMSFAEKDKPLYLISVNKTDISTATDKLWQYHCVYEDERGIRHTMNFELPKFINNKFMYLNGSDKIFLNQILPLPVTKTSPTTVQVSGMYNKVFISRFGKNVSNKLTKFMKYMTKIKPSQIRVVRGSNLDANIEYLTSMEYDELSSKYSMLTLKDTGITLYFNQKEIRDICESEDLKYEEGQLPFAIQNSKSGYKLFCLSEESGNVLTDDGKETDQSPIDFIIDNLHDEEAIKEFSKIAGSKRAVYTRCKIMKKWVPVILLISFLTGLEKVMCKIKADPQFTEEKPKYDPTKRGCIKFADGYLTFNLYPVNTGLLMNGLLDIPTEEYNYLDFNEKDIYFDIFQTMYRRRNIGTAFENFQQLFIDPITKEILKDFKLPTDFIDLIIYANSLLENNAYDKDGDLKNYRLRSNEMIVDHLYKCMAGAYEKYRATADAKSPTKFSLKPMAVINEMYNSQIVEEYSNLNPIFEIDRMRSSSYKGPGGCNIDDSFKIDKRAYNDSMLGILGQSTPVAGNVGVARVLALNPNVTSLRGYLNPGDPKHMERYDQTNLLSGAEMLVPMTATHDDPQRVSMASTQSRHTLGIIDSDPPLFGYGADKSLAKLISDKFAFKAKNSGVVEEVNTKLGYMMLRYNDGKRDVVDIMPRQLLNTGSGFYINSQLTPVLNEGDRFDENDVVAANNDFFMNDSVDHEVIYKSGPLARVAVVHGSFVFEDTTLITERFAERLSSYIVENKEIRIGRNANIYSIAKKGDKVKVNDPFLVFDESYQDEYLNQLLAKMNQTDADGLLDASKTKIKSKWNGEIVDVKIYYTCEKEEMSETLRKVITDYEKDIIKRKKNFEDAGINRLDLVSLNEEPEPTIPVNGKITGTKMEDFDILIKFYVKVLDKFSVGDKMTFSTALKGINQSLIPKGSEPYLVSDPSIKIDAFMGVSGVYARMCGSSPITMALNTVLIGAENKIKDILEDKPVNVISKKKK